MICFKCGQKRVAVKKIMAHMEPPAEDNYPYVHDYFCVNRSCHLGVNLATIKTWKRIDNPQRPIV